MNKPTDGSSSFDLRVHHRDPKTGKIIRVTPYIMKCSKEHGTKFERDGVEYYANGEMVHAPQTVEVPEPRVEKGHKK